MKTTKTPAWERLDTAIRQASGIAFVLWQASAEPGEHASHEGNTLWALNDLLHEASQANDEMARERVKAHKAAREQAKAEGAR